MSLLLAALDQTIVGTAMPRVIAELHGFDRYARVTTAYLLTSTVAVPIVGKLSDLYGRKPFLMGGAIVFVLASAACGASQDMSQLILFRAVQGLGGGTLMANVFAGASALFPPAQRARMQGLFGAVFGLASVIGPLVGGYLTDHFSWRAVFYINLPVGLIALFVLWRSFPTIQTRLGPTHVDYLGGVLLVLGLVPVLLAFSLGGTSYPWLSPVVVGLFLLGGASLVAFVFAEARAREPLLSLGFFQNRNVAVSAIAVAMTGLGMFSVVLFVPLFIQAVLGSTASNSGTVLTHMILAMVVSSVAAGQLVGRIGRYRLVGALSPLLVASGLALLAGMGPETTFLVLVRNIVLVGIGLGIGQPVFAVVPQNAVSFDELGAVTAFIQLARQIGATLGAAVLGSLLTDRFAAGLQAALPAPVRAAVPPPVLAQLDSPQALLNPQTAQALREGLAQTGPLAEALYAQLIAATRLALSASLHDVFLAAAGAAAVAALLVREVPLRTSDEDLRAPAGGRAGLAAVSLHVQNPS